MGTGLFASSDIHTGEDVLKISSPFVTVLDTPRLDDTCSGCFGKAQAIADQSAELKACTGCQVVKYCDKVGAFYYLSPSRKAQMLIMLFLPDLSS